MTTVQTCNICLLEKPMRWRCDTCRSGALCALCFVRYQLGGHQSCCPVCKTGSCSDSLLWKVFFPDSASVSIFTSDGESLKPDWFKAAIRDLRASYVRRHFCEMIFALTDMLSSSCPHAPHTEAIEFLRLCASKTMKIKRRLFAIAATTLMPHIDMTQVAEDVAINCLRALYQNKMLHGVLHAHRRKLLEPHVITRMCAMHFTRAQWVLPLLQLIGDVGHACTQAGLRAVLDLNVFTIRARKLFTFLLQRLEKRSTVLDLSGLVIGERAARLLEWTRAQPWNPIGTVHVDWDKQTNPQMLVHIARSASQHKWWELGVCDIMLITSHMRENQWEDHMLRFSSFVQGFHKAAIPNQYMPSPLKKRKLHHPNREIICIT